MADSKIYSTVIRQATEADLASILVVHEQAFKQPNEARLVRKLIEINLHIPELCLVAQHEATVVGHILMSVANLDNDDEKPVIALAPVAVLPEYQNGGIGGLLCRKSLSLAEGTKYGAVICLGHSNYYSRFGFETASKYGIHAPFDVPDENFMVYRLPNWSEKLVGTVRYASPFDEV